MNNNNPLQEIDGFKVYAPDLINQSGSFVSNAHSTLQEHEKDYFWFSERRKLICFLMKKYFSEAMSFCEIGCGGGYVLSGIKEILPDAKLSGTEIFINGLKIARHRIPEANLFQADILNFPFVDEFEVVGAFDVIEHLDDDKQALKSIYDLTKKGGGVIITVPQHKMLWTSNDDYACHKRRYSRKELLQKCNDAGFEIVRSTSYITLLLPVYILNCLLIGRDKSQSDIDVTKQFNLHPLLNKFFKIVCKVEFFFTRIGINFFAGGSLVCVLKKS